jgi:hypothetical protein
VWVSTRSGCGPTPARSTRRSTECPDDIGVAATR